LDGDDLERLERGHLGHVVLVPDALHP
jgi:hypothetical protein